MDASGPLTVWIALLGVLPACKAPEAPAVRLYRSSPVDPTLVYHVATFDAPRDYGEHYNRDNCELARSLFQSQPGVSVIYRCAP